MKQNQISESELKKIYVELTHRIQHIAIAIQGKKQDPLQEVEEYELCKDDMPKVGETVYAFLNWNCAILTAFRGADSDDLNKWKEEGLSDEEIKQTNFKRNIARNEELKKKLREQHLLFRGVDGWYKEYGTETYVKEMSMFVTNINEEDKRLNEDDFFQRVFRLAEYYEQDCFLYTFSGLNRMAFLIATNDNGRRDFHGNIHFAGPLYTHIEGLDAWTQCKDGKISFLLKGMVLEGGTGNKKIKIGEGNIFDVESYQPDGILVFRKESHEDLADACDSYDGSVPLVQHVFSKDNYTPEYIHEVIFRSLKKLRDQKCKRIGLHCSVSVNDSSTEGAAAAYDAIKQWAKRYDKNFDWIVIVDIFGDYGKVIHDRI